MLTYFPTPYRGEWWYSVLCRYHVRSGNQKYATTLHELYGSRPLVHGRLFPGGSCHAVVSRLPKGVLNLEEVLRNHTLMPYYLRFYPAEKKQSALSSLLSGKGAGLTSIALRTPEGKEGPKYCPTCYREDAEKYGEPYWRREHQIPLMPLCPIHGHRLCQYEISFARLSEVFLPLSSVAPGEAIGREKDWEGPLTEMLRQFLTLPHEIGPTLGYSNLVNTLLSKGLDTGKIQSKAALDARKIQQACSDFYGDGIAQQYFSKLSPAILSRIGKWTLSSPERYALLSVMAGLGAEELFGEEMAVKDPLLEQLLSYREKGTVYRKDQLAELLGVGQAQLDSLARKYQVVPFWKQIAGESDSKRHETIRITLTPEEKSRICEAAKVSGNGQVAVFARAVLLQQANLIGGLGDARKSI